MLLTLDRFTAQQTNQTCVATERMVDAPYVVFPQPPPSPACDIARTVIRVTKRTRYAYKARSFHFSGVNCVVICTLFYFRTFSVKQRPPKAGACTSRRHNIQDRGDVVRTATQKRTAIFNINHPVQPPTPTPQAK